MRYGSTAFNLYSLTFSRRRELGAQAVHHLFGGALAGAFHQRGEALDGEAGHVAAPAVGCDDAMRGHRHISEWERKC
jgi:hypothetical protein